VKRLISIVQSGTLRYFHAKNQGDRSKRFRDIPFLKLIRTTNERRNERRNDTTRDEISFRRGQKKTKTKRKQKGIRRRGGVLATLGKVRLWEPYSLETSQEIWRFTNCVFQGEN